MQPFVQPLMETVLRYPKQYATTLSNRLWKRYATAYGNGATLPKAICNRFKQPLMETVLSYPRQYATALDNRLWKR
jgi:hypothetical protein